MMGPIAFVGFIALATYVSWLRAKAKRRRRARADVQRIHPSNPRRQDEIDQIIFASIRGER